MTVAVFAAIVIIVFGLICAAVSVNGRPTNASSSWTPKTGRSLGVGIALGGVILPILVLSVEPTIDR